MHLRRLLLAVCVIIALALGADAANWPRFRGPNGTGDSHDAGIPVRWTEKDIVWKVPLSGAGNSSPIIWGERIFLQSASDDARERYLICLRTSDGKELWRKSVAGSRAKMHPKNTGASSTPATDGERVYAYFWDGEAVGLYAFDFKGEQLWKYDIGRFSSDHGAGASPMVYAGKVILLNDQGEGASVIALDGKTGSKAWETKRDHYENRACYSTPFVLERKGQPTEIVVASTMGITGYDPDTGAKDWQYDWVFDARPLRTVASPLLAEGGMIVVNSGDGGGDRNTVAITPGGKNGAQPGFLWESKRKEVMPYVPCLLSRGNHIYWVSDNRSSGYAGCTDAHTGAMLWYERLGAPFTASPILIEDKVYAVNEAGDVFVFAAEAKYRLLAKNSVGEQVFATPAVADGRLYIRGKSHLFCIGKGK
jgi:outer membrane protein assembly factor BamB